MEELDEFVDTDLKAQIHGFDGVRAQDLDIIYRGAPWGWCVCVWGGQEIIPVATKLKSVVKYLGPS